VKKYFLEIYFPLSIIIAPMVLILTGMKLSWAFCTSILGIMLIHLYLNKKVRQVALQQIKNIFSTPKKDF